MIETRPAVAGIIRTPPSDLGDLLVGHGGVAGGEVDRAGDQPADALAAADGVIVDGDVRIGLLEPLDPRCVERGREGGAGTADQLVDRAGPGGCRAPNRRLGAMPARRTARRCVLVMSRLRELS